MNLSIRLLTIFRSLTTSVSSSICDLLSKHSLHFLQILLQWYRRNSYENDNGNDNGNDNNNDVDEVDDDNNDNDDEDDDDNNDDELNDFQFNFDMELSLPMIEKMTTNRGQVIQKEKSWPSPHSFFSSYLCLFK